MATRRCKRGKLRTPKRTRKGGKRICKKKVGRKSKKSKCRKPKKSRRRRTFRIHSGIPKEYLEKAAQIIKDLAVYVQHNFKKIYQDPQEIIPNTLIQIYKLVPEIIKKSEEEEVLAIGEKIRENNNNGVRTSEKDIRRMLRILVKTRMVIIAMLKTKTN